MRAILAAVVLLGALVPAGVVAFGADAAATLKQDGAFAFPQAQAKVLCDGKDLRVSVWNDAKYLYVQAVVWPDGDDSLGETDDGRPIGDTAVLCLDADADQKVSPNVDRNYSLNPWPSRPGLNYSVLLGERSSSHLKGDSAGRGAIRYVAAGEGRRVRVDSWVIPLAEIGRKPGDKIRLAYWASSPKPALTVNSVGYRGRGTYYSHHLPRKDYHEIALTDRPASLDVSRVPDGRRDPVPLAKKPVQPVPAVGAAPPEVVAKDWLNAERPPTLAALKGRVVLVEFWATWCVPCVEGIPRLNALHDAHAGDGLTILGVTDQSRAGIEKFLKGTPMKYAVGAGSEAAAAYGVSALPHAFLIGRDGKLLWQGSPTDEGFEERIRAALKKK